MTDAEHKLKQLRDAMKAAAESALRFDGSTGDRARLFVAGMVGATAAILDGDEAETINRLLQKDEQ